MGNRSDCAFPAASRRQPAVLGSKIFVLGFGCGLGRLGEGSFYPGVASAGASALPLARALVVARTYLGPRGQMRRSRESTHVGPGLRQYLLGTATAHPGYRVQPFNRLLSRFHPSCYLLVQFFNLRG